MPRNGFNIYNCLNLCFCLKYINGRPLNIGHMWLRLPPISVHPTLSL